jgi:hypothetical protein
VRRTIALLFLDIGARNLRVRDHWGNPGVDGRIILRRIFRKWEVGICGGLSWLWIETGGGQVVNAVMNLRVP